MFENYKRVVEYAKELQKFETNDIMEHFEMCFMEADDFLKIAEMEGHIEKSKENKEVWLFHEKTKIDSAISQEIERIIEKGYFIDKDHFWGVLDEESKELIEAVIDVNGNVDKIEEYKRENKIEHMNLESEEMRKNLERVIQEAIQCFAVLVKNEISQKEEVLLLVKQKDSSLFDQDINYVLDSKFENDEKFKQATENLSDEAKNQLLDLLNNNGKEIFNSEMQMTNFEEKEIVDNKEVSEEFKKDVNDMLDNKEGEEIEK